MKPEVKKTLETSNQLLEMARMHGDDHTVEFALIISLMRLYKTRGILLCEGLTRIASQVANAMGLRTDDLLTHLLFSHGTHETPGMTDPECRGAIERTDVPVKEEHN